MPTYEYRCENGHTFEVMHAMSDEPIATCQECGAPVERIFHPVAVHFKGSGFYTTDYARDNAKEGSEGGAKDGESDAKPEKKESKGEKKESKKDSKDSKDSKGSTTSKAS